MPPSSKGGEKKKNTKKFKLGSKARRALKLQKQRRQNSGMGGGEFVLPLEDEEEENAAGGESKTKKTTSSFAYDESQDEELKRLRALYSNPNNSNDDENNKWSAIDVDASELMLGSSEEGFVSLEVLDFSSKKKKKKDEDDEDDGKKRTTKTKEKKEDVSKEKKKKKKKREESVAVVVEEEEEEKEDMDGSEKPPPSKKEARILKRKKRWKEKVEEAKRRKKMAKMNEKTNGVERREDDADENEEEEEEDKKNEDDDGDGGDFAAWLEYDLHPLLLKAIRAHLKFTSPTPIQEKVLHPAIKGRMDIVGAAETGSGKTLAFGLPILQRLMQDKEEEKWYEDYPDEEKPGKGKKHLRALIVTPTRELALQVAKMLSDLAIYTDIQIAAIVGGMAKQKQERVLKKQPEIIVATPGRLWELIRDGEKHLTNLERLTFLTLDEADRMVERGHFKELESVIKSIPEPPETRRIARSAKLTKRKQPMMTKVSDNSGKKNKKKGEKDDEEEEEQNEGEEKDEEEKDPTDNRIMARDRQTFVFSATLTVPDEVKYKLDRKKPQASSKKASGKRKNGDDNKGDDGDDENAYRLEPPKDLASTNTMGNLMKMVPFYGRVKLCDVSDSVTKKKGDDDDKSRKATTTTKVASKVHEAALECTDDERDALTLYLLSAHDGKPSIVFVNAISSLRRLTALLKLMKVNAVGLHAGMQQRARLKALDRFKSSKASALIATDVAARGLDIKGVELVVHYQVPRQADAYVHRCGRTGRANQSGVSVALVTPKERSRYLAMLAAMGRERGFRLPPFPVAEETVREATKRVQLAKRLDAIVHKNEKKRADKAWKKRTAEAMDLGLDADDDSDFDDDDSDQDVMQFSDNEDGVEVIEDFELYGKKKMKKELTQKKLEKEAEKRNVTKREISLRNELERLLKTPLGANRRSMLTSQKFPTREGGKQFEKVKKQSSSSASSSVSALDVLKSGGVGVESGPAAGAVAGGAMGARKRKSSSSKFK